MTESRSLVDLIQETMAAGDLDLPLSRQAESLLRSTPEIGCLKIEEVGRLVSVDPVLAGQVLRRANSDFYRGLRQVSSISAALMRLGAERIIDLLLNAARAKTSNPENPVLQRQIQAFWEHSLASAAACRWLSVRAGFRDLTEEAFLAGLFHDIGKLFLLAVLDRIAVSNKYQIDLSDALVGEVLGELHLSQGHRLMIEWGMPEKYCRAAGHHHDEPFDANDPLLGLVRLADQACRKLGLGSPRHPEIVLAATPEARILGLSEISLAELEIMLEDDFLLEPKSSQIRPARG